MFIQQQKGTAGKGAGAYIATTLGGFGSFLASFILVLVYIFLFIYYRKHLKKFFLSLVSERHKQNAELVIANSQKVAQTYLGGMSLMIMGLWIMYGIGFSIVGVDNALFFAILCGLLKIVPFVGNLAGTSLTILMALAQGGGPGMILGIAVTYSVVQLVQSYLLEPLIVGAGVRINPLFTILSLVAGEFIWGIPGMVLALPLAGILKIVFEHVRPLQPFGFLMGEKEKKGEPTEPAPKSN